MRRIMRSFTTLLGLAVICAQAGSLLAQNLGVSGANGVLVDAEGVLRRQTFADPTGEILRERVAAARATLNPKVATRSKLRKVSLNRLEAAIQRQHDSGKQVSDEMFYLAGLTRAQYLFYYPETKDIVLAGPAEAWVTDVAGHVRGIESGRPTLQLQDLIVALRAYAPGGRQPSALLCSIDPTPEGLARMQQFLREVGPNITPDDTETIVNGLRTSMGMQNIRVGGLSPRTHFAQVMIECDYRMKLIGVGLETPPVKLVNYVDRAANSGTTNRNASQRWYFIPDYQCVRVAADQMGMELVGDGVKLVGEDQVINRDGTRSTTNRSNRASELFTKSFTQKYPELAAREPIFAELRNVIDLAVVAAFIRQQDFFGKAGWEMTTFGKESAMPVETYTAPVQVETTVAAVWKGGQLLTPVSGGVRIEPHRALAAPNVLSDGEGKVSGVRDSIGLKDLAADRWWWD